MRILTYLSLIATSINCLSVQAKEFICTKYPNYPIILEQSCDRLEGCRYPVSTKASANVNIYEHPSKNAKIVDRLERCELIQDFVPYAVIKKTGRVKVITSGEELSALGVKKNDVLPLLQTLADAWVSVCIGDKEVVVYESVLASDLVPNSTEPVYNHSAFVKIITPSQFEHWAGLKTTRGKTGYAMNSEKSKPASFYLNDHSDGRLFCPGDKLAPPGGYVDKGACPFECCTYRDWIAGIDTPIYTDLTKRKQVGVVKQDEVVKALTGEVHIVPTKVRVVYNHGKYKTGDVFYLLTPIGEGYSRTWFNGSLDEEEIPSIYKYGGDPYCKEPSEECWARLESEVGASTWWVKVQRKDGTIGWTDQAGSFDNKDACG